MFLSKIFLVLICAGFFPFVPNNMVSEPADKARIAVTQEENWLRIKGYFLNTSSIPQNLSYKMYTVINTKSGSQRNNQGGAFKVEAGEEAQLSGISTPLNTRHNYNTSPVTISVKLLVFRHEELISKDSISYDVKIN